MLNHDPAAAKQLLTLRSSLHTVLFPLSDVEGKFRTRRFEVLAGRQGTHTRCLEYGYRFEIEFGTPNVVDHRLNATVSQFMPSLTAQKLW